MTKFTPPAFEVIELKGQFIVVGILNAREAEEQLEYFRNHHSFKVEYQRPVDDGLLILSLINST